jgi:PAS domain S-box-containing protein
LKEWKINRMSVKIIITSPHSQFTSLALATSKELGIEATIVEAVLEEAAQKVLEICNNNNVNVIVSRAGTALAISETISIPIITVEANDFDILTALMEARRYSDKIAYLGFDYPSPPYEFDSLIDIMGVEIQQLYFKNQNDMVREIKRAKAQGISVIVSGSTRAMKITESEGLRGVLVKTEKRTMVNALQRAKWVDNVRSNDKRSSRMLETIVNISHEGIIAIDQNGMVKVSNNMAEQLLGLKGYDIMGREFSSFLTDPKAVKLIKNQIPVMGEVIKINENNIIVNSSPLTSDNKNFGLVVTFQEVSQLEKLEQNVRRQLNKNGLIAKVNFEDIITNADVMKKNIEKAKKYAFTDGTILIYGESGTGKEMFAQSIHNFSERRNQPFVAVNCAAIPENLIESELFGYEEGAFTGAKKGGKQGLFELAHKGTLFLDELSSIPMKVQVQLLRVLQEKQIFRVGGDKIIPVDVRIIAATNEELKDAVTAGGFRDDLYYRINVLNIVIPPLRERKDDIPELVHYLIKVFNKRYNKNITGVSQEVKEYLIKHEWPGNIRELMNVIERQVILADTPIIGTENFTVDDLKAVNKKDLKNTSNSYGAAAEGVVLDDGELIRLNPGTMESMENQIISWYLQKYNGNKTKITEKLGICRTTLWKWLKRIGVE